ncbi:hypothetical protein QTP88_017740 [Uroleucon formosanum]
MEFSDNLYLTKNHQIKHLQKNDSNWCSIDLPLLICIFSHFYSKVCNNSKYRPELLDKFVLFLSQLVQIPLFDYKYLTHLNQLSPYNLCNITTYVNEFSVIKHSFHFESFIEKLLFIRKYNYQKIKFTENVLVYIDFLIKLILRLNFKQNFYRPLSLITAPQSVFHSSLSFVNSSGLSTLSSSVHLFFDLLRGLLPSGFQFSASFITPLDFYTCPSQLIFPPFFPNICTISSFLKSSQICIPN